MGAGDRVGTPQRRSRVERWVRDEAFPPIPSEFPGLKSPVAESPVEEVKPKAEAGAEKEQKEKVEEEKKEEAKASPKEEKAEKKEKPKVHQRRRLSPQWRQRCLPSQ